MNARFYSILNESSDTYDVKYLLGVKMLSLPKQGEIISIGENSKQYEIIEIRRHFQIDLPPYSEPDLSEIFVKEVEGENHFKTINIEYPEL